MRVDSCGQGATKTVWFLFVSMEEEGEGDSSGRTIVAVCYTNKTLGLAAFDEVTNVIHAEGIGVGLEDVEAVFEKLKTLMRPSMFIVHPLFVANQGLLDLLVSGGDDGSAQPYSYTVSKSTTWNAQAALELMCTKLLIRGGSDGGGTGEGGGGRKGTYLNLASSVDLQCDQVKMVRNGFSPPLLPGGCPLACWPSLVTPPSARLSPPPQPHRR